MRDGDGHIIIGRRHRIFRNNIPFFLSVLLHINPQFLASLWSRRIVILARRRYEAVQTTIVSDMALVDLNDPHFGLLVIDLFFSITLFIFFLFIPTC